MKQEVNGGKGKGKLLIMIEGMDKERILKRLGWVVRNGYVYEPNGSQVVSRLDEKPIKVKQVKGVFPGSRILISDIIEVESYISENP